MIFSARAAALALPILICPAASNAMESGQYSGIADGGVLDMRVSGRSFALTLTSDTGCGGQVEGVIEEIGRNAWRATIRGDDGGACTLDFIEQGTRRYNIEETSCTFFHGYACSFDGFVERQ